MMVNGKILCAASRAPYSNTSPTDPGRFPIPTYFYVFDPDALPANAFTLITAPNLSGSGNFKDYYPTFLALPDGKVFYAEQGSNQYYVYTPSGSPLAAGMPALTSVTKTAPSTYQIIGTKFNGISEGANWGDDGQMNTNFPLVRLVNGTNVYYCRTYNWNSTGVQRGTQSDNAFFTLPAGLPLSTYSLYVVVNGIASAPVLFSLVCNTDVIISGIYSTLVTQSSTYIKSTGQTTILSTASVSLDANPLAGNIELKPTSPSDFFLADPGATGVFVAQTLDGCGNNVPSRPAATIVTTGVSTILSNPSMASPCSPPDVDTKKTEEIPITKALSVFPNPSKGSFIVKSSSDMQNAKLQLVDVKGQVQSIIVENIDSHSKRVKCGYTSNGVYMLKIISSKRSEVIKVVIQ